MVSTKGRDKNAQILEITKALNPYLAMIFVNTKERADELHSYLVSNGLKVAKIHGDIPPRERKRTMNQIKNCHTNTLWRQIWQRVGLILKELVMLSMMLFRKIYHSLCTVLDVQDVMI